MSWLDVIRGSWLMLRTWAANRRTVEEYASLNAAHAWRPLLSEVAWKTWRASFGPWIGSDWHGSRSGWLLLRGPSSEYWFDRWTAYLERCGVAFFWRQSLFRLDFDGEKITSACLESGACVSADVYVLATNPFAAAEILGRTPDLEQQDELRFFRPLTQGGPHTQVSLRLAFSERRRWPRKRAGLVIADSEFDLTRGPSPPAWAQFREGSA